MSGQTMACVVIWIFISMIHVKLWPLMKGHLHNKDPIIVTMYAAYLFYTISVVSRIMSGHPITYHIFGTDL